MCKNRLRLWHRLNPDVAIYGLYGGPPADSGRFVRELGAYLDDFWAFPLDRNPEWKWRNGDLLLTEWFVEHGQVLPWDSIFVAQWDTVAVEPLGDLLPPLREGEMLLSGLRPIREVESWWQWTQGSYRPEYEKFMGSVRARYGEVSEPLCCQFIGVVAPRQFFARYSSIDEPELGFLEYKVPVYAQIFGIPLVADTSFRPWWAEDPATAGVKRTERLVHAWPTQLRLSMMLLEGHRPGGRRVFHPYRGIYPHDPRALAELFRHRFRSP